MTTTQQSSNQPTGTLTTTAGRAFRPTLLVSGVVLTAAQVGQQLTDTDGPGSVAFAQSTLHLIVSLGALAGFVLFAFSLVQLHSRHRGAGWVEGATFALAAVFTMLAVGATWADTIFDPFIAQLAPAVFGGDNPPPLIDLGFTVTFSGLAVTVAAYAIVLVVVGRLARLPLILVAVGALVTASPFTLVGALLIAAGLVWLALAPARQRTARERSGAAA